jgi:hypothetical protein
MKAFGTLIGAVLMVAAFLASITVLLAIFWLFQIVLTNIVS